MSVFLSILVDGVAYGMILFMISVGLSVTMGLMRVINLAHGGFAMIGGAATHWLIEAQGIPFFAAAALGVVFTMALALPLERIVYRRIYELGELEQVLATIGLAFLMIATVNLLLGSDLLVIRVPKWFSHSIELGFRTLTVHRFVVIICGAVAALALWLALERTRFGIRLRASVDNVDSASALGINTSLVYAATFVLGSGLAAMGGILGAELLPIEAYYPLRYMVLFLIVVAVGGLGSIAGSLAAALVLGTLDTAARYLIPEFGAIAFFLAMMAILAVRPQGLLGKN